ncbi:hypothetical protein ACFQU7_43320 [Pseudoroseomonas wenyumeiae]
MLERRHPHPAGVGGTPQDGEAALCVRLEAARDQGELPASSDCAMLASYVMTVNQGMAVQAKAGTPKATLDALIEHVLSTWPSTDPNSR